MTDEDRQKLAASKEAAWQRIDARRRLLRAQREAAEWVPDMLGRQLFGNSEEFDRGAE
jgi:hypothetical protein